jgi:hypothetical protein
MVNNNEAGDAERLNTTASSVAAAFVFAFLALYGLYRIQFGIDDIKDEGFYLASPLRYALGDLPFRDEILNPARMFDLVLAPAFILLPNLGVYELRLAWLIVQLASIFSLFLLLRRFSSDFVVALACGVVAFLPNMIWTPGYHTMSAVFFVLAWSCWLRGCLAVNARSGAAAGLLAGLFFLLGALSYLPLVVTLVVPGIVLIGCWARRDLGSSRSLSTLMLLVAAGSCAAAFVLWLRHMQLIDDWWYASRALTSVPHYARSTGAKLIEFFGDYLAEWPIWLGAGVLTFGMGLAISKTAGHDRPSTVGRRAISGTMAAIAIGVVLLLITDGQIGTLLERNELTLRIVSAVLGLHLGLAALRLVHPKRVVDTDWRLVSLSLGFGATILAILHGVLSTHAFKCMIAIVPLMANAVVLVERSLAACGDFRTARLQARLFVIAFALAIGLGTIPTIPSYVYGEARGLAALTEAFQHPLLRGIRGSPSQVRRVEALSSYLMSRLDRGDYLLIYEHAPLYYYLTGTRPAIDHAWTYRVIPATVRERSIEKMIADDRIPTYVVQNMESSPSASFRRRDPIHAVVVRHYEVEAQFGGFRIWRLSSDRADVEPAGLVGEQWRRRQIERRARAEAERVGGDRDESTPDAEN